MNDSVTVSNELLSRSHELIFYSARKCLKEFPDKLSVKFVKYRLTY